MNIVYLIGNGFDLNLGLKTRYSDFYKYLKKSNLKSRLLEEFLNYLSENDNNLWWSDLEVVLGEYTLCYNIERAEEYVKLLDEIQDLLSKYLSTQKISKIRILKKHNLSKNLIRFYNDFTGSERVKFENKLKESNYFVDIISFNYTDTIEKLFSYNNGQVKNLLRSVTHIHGTLKNNMVLGVNDETQITNAEYTNSELVTGNLIKPIMNKKTETYRDESCFNLIIAADIICIYGMSLGKTDKVWWEAINNALLSNNKLYIVIFDKNDKIKPIREYRAFDYKEDIKNKFFSYGKKLEHNIEVNLRRRVIVCINSKIFDFN